MKNLIFSLLLIFSLSSCNMEIQDTEVDETSTQKFIPYQWHLYCSEFRQNEMTYTLIIQSEGLVIVNSTLDSLNLEIKKLELEKLKSGK